MSSFYIDGVECSVSSVKPSSHGFSEVFINNYSSRHLLPTELTEFKRSFKVRTGGHSYEFKFTY